MKRLEFRLLTMLAGALVAPVCLAQPDDGNAPPLVQSIEWRIFRNPTSVLLLASPLPFNAMAPFDPDTDTARELDVLVGRVTATDPDFAGGDDNGGGDGIYFLQQAIWIPVPGYPAPEPPPIPQNRTTFTPEEGDGLAPAPPATTVDFFVVFTIPPYTGRNQARLRGDINYDVAWSFLIALSNEQQPDGCNFDIEGFLEGCVPTSGVTIFTDLIFAVENPVVQPANPPVFADAGADVMVAAGSTVQLDGTRTFDSYNTGFSALDPEVLDKDDITYAWEWIGGPERVDPIVRDPVNAPAIAEVTLNTVGNYSFRLLASDGVNPIPTSDAVLVEVVSTIPENRAPRAAISRPTPVIVTGSIITLDGTPSSDPDGDPLSFRWRQTDELGGVLPFSELRDVFQPLGGIETPISSWQAIRPGTYYFRLLVSDGRLEDSARVEINVVAPGTLGVAFARNDVIPPADAGATPSTNDQGQPAPTATPNQVAPLCGGSLFMVGFVPLALLMMRGRQRG